MQFGLLLAHFGLFPADWKALNLEGPLDFKSLHVFSTYFILFKLARFSFCHLTSKSSINITSSKHVATTPLKGQGDWQRMGELASF